MWFRIAAKTGCSVARAKAETTSTQFLMWGKRLEDEANDFHRWDWFLARICFEIYLVRKAWTGGKVELTAEDYLLKFGPKKDDKSGGRIKSEDEKVQDAESLKSALLGALGLTPDGAPAPTPPRKDASLNTRQPFVRPPKSGMRS